VDTLWNAMPFLRILIAIVAGVLMASYLTVPIGIVLAIIVVCSAFILIWKATVSPTTRFIYDWLEGIAFFLLMISVGYGRSYVHQALNYDSHFSYHLESYDSFVFELIQPAEPKARSTQLLGKINSIVNETSVTETSGKAILYLKIDSTTQLPNYGDKLLVKGKLNKLVPPSNPGQFDYSAYQANENVYYSSFIKPGQWTILEKNESTSFWTVLYKTRQHLLSIVDQRVQAENEKAVASALLLGYRELLPKEIKDVYAHTGSMHVLAVSGLHVGIVVMLLNYLLSFLKRRNGGKAIHFVLIVSFVWLFAFLTGFKPSVARAAVMFTFLQVGLSQKKSMDIVHITIISAVTLLLINPNNLFRAGFQLSYGALLGILFFQQRIYDLFFVYNRWLSKAWKLTSVGIAAQIGTLPLSLYYFGFFPLVFFLSNLLIILGATAVLGIGLTLFVVSPFEKLAALVGQFLEWAVWLINRYLQVLGNIPNMVIEDIHINGLQVFLLYLFISSITYFLVMGKKGAFKFAMMLLLVFSVLTSFTNINKVKDQSLVVYDTSYNFCLGLHSDQGSVIVHDFKTVEDNGTFTFNVQPHLIELGPNTVEYIHLSELDTLEQQVNAVTNFRNGFIQFNDLRLFIPTKKHRVDTNAQVIETDYMLVPRGHNWSSKYLDEFVQAEKAVIFASQFRPKKNQRFQELSKSWPQHFIRSDGAFVLEME